jgi:hypothetical protein
MAATAVKIPNLWPEEVNVDVLPPSAVLKVQAANLSERTRGLLEGAVRSVQTDKLVSYSLDLVAPQVPGVRHTVLVAKHSKGKPYPVTIEASTFYSHGPNYGSADASSYVEFLQLVGQVLQSPEVRAVLESLIAIRHEEVERK